MASPYDYPTAADDKPPRFSVMTVIAIAFAVFMVWQVTDTIGESQDKVAEQTVQEGDRIEYHYVARLPDGTLWGTSRLDVARAANETEGFRLEPEFTYQPKKAPIDPAQPGLGWGPEADEQVIGAYVGQTLRFTVAGEHGTGDWEPFTPGQDGIPRELMPQGFQRTVFLQEPQAAQAEGNAGSPGFNLTQLDQSIGPIEQGFVFNADRTFPPSWDIEFTDVNWDNRSITFRHTIQDGQFFDVPSLPGGVTVLLHDDESRLTYRLDLEEGATFVVHPQSELNQAGFTPGSYLVREVAEDHVDLGYHSGVRPDAVGEPLSITLTILDRTEGGDAGTGTGGGTGPGTPGTGQGAAGDGHTDHTH